MSKPMRPGDPAYWMLLDDFTSVPVPGVFRDSCYICRDPEFAQMGLPLCRPCPECKRRQSPCEACEGKGGVPGDGPCTDCLGTGTIGLPGHIPADDITCTDCEYEDGPEDYPDGPPSSSGHNSADAVREREEALSQAIPGHLGKILGEKP